MTTEVSPFIYDRIERIKDGKTLKIRIQQLTPLLVDRGVDFMCSYFLPREPISSYLKIHEDEATLKNIRKLWKEVGMKGAAIIALVEDENVDSATPRIAGCNMTTISNKNDKEEQISQDQTESFRKLLTAVINLTKEGNLYERYEVDSYLTALGLTVHPDFHGIGLGIDILKAREKVCKIYGLTMTATVFTAGISQYIAAKVGFDTILKYEYKTFKVNGQIPFENLAGSIALMALKY